jgi:BirA family biotin operon repressor/biotin-[acetyl-CoA-carboxylase] ligase
MTWVITDADADAFPLAALREGGTPPEAVRAGWAWLGSGTPRRAGGLPVPGLSGYSGVLVVNRATDSQFDRLLAGLRGASSPAPALLAIALTGEKFHGYRGRPWRAEAGNLHLSACFPVQRALGAAAVALSALPAVATLDALTPWRGEAFQPGLKWVNDVLWQGRKIAGVITATQTRGAETEAVVFGIGLNRAIAPAVEPSVFVPASGCLREALGEGTPALPDLAWAVAEALAFRLEEFLREGPRPALDAYRAGSLLTGRAVRIWPEASVNDLADLRRSAPPRRGVVEDIDDALCLRLRGDPHPVERGRLALEEVCAAFGLGD